MGWQTWNHFENDSSYKFKSDSCVTNLTVLNHLWFLSLFTGTHIPSVTYSHVAVTEAYWCRGVALSVQIQRATPSSDVIFCNSEQLLWISKHSKNMIKHSTIIPQFIQYLHSWKMSVCIKATEQILCMWNGVRFLVTENSFLTYMNFQWAIEGYSGLAFMPGNSHCRASITPAPTLLYPPQWFRHLHTHV